MVSHKCERCGYLTDKSNHLKQHLQRKSLCVPTLADVPRELLLEKLRKPVHDDACRGCHKKLYSVYCVRRHCLTCPAYKQYLVTEELAKEVAQLRAQQDAGPLVQKLGKKKISATMKAVVWNTHIGEDVGSTTCCVCQTYKITQLSFHCGHIVSEANGGPTTVANLLPICGKCNCSMGVKNLHDFKQSLFGLQSEASYLQ